jgi:hypothetical protein
MIGRRAGISTSAFERAQADGAPDRRDPLPAAPAVSAATKLRSAAPKQRRAPVQIWPARGLGNSGVRSRCQIRDGIKVASRLACRFYFNVVGDEQMHL